jgi:hypothetical protein
MAKLIIWDKDQAKRELSKRLQASRDARKNFEYQWQENERAVFNTRGGQSASPNLSVSFQSEVELGITDIDQSQSDVGVNYVYKNYRFLHSQMSANPPSAVPRPTTNDPSDRRKADAADRLIRHALRKYNLQEEMDRSCGATLLYGTSFLKTVFDPDKGEPMDFDESTGEITMDGDFDFYPPSAWDIYADPDARKWEDVRFVFERFLMPWEEAMHRFGEAYEELLKKNRIQEDQAKNEYGARSALTTKSFDVVELFQYWETGLPVNGFQGRFCWCTKEGEVLGEVGPNPFRFAPPAIPDPMDKTAEPKNLPPRAYLPYHILTDVDIPDTYWGKASIAYQAPLQDLYNRLMNVTLDNLQAHGVARMILPEGTEIADDSITNSPWDIIKMTGTQPPSFMEPMPLPAAITELQQLVRAGIDDMAGVNESMFGQQSREQSGFSMQYATNQGNMIRRRLFNKYVLFVESVFKAYLNMVRKHWSEPRMISVLGKEKALESAYVKGTDIDGGFDLVVEYGTSLSLDPTMRRQELMQMYPFFKEAGIEPRRILQLVRLNEIDGAYDLSQMAADRQREVFEEILATGEYQPPRLLQDHLNMLKYCEEYLMTAEFKHLEPAFQVLIERHVTERQQIAAQAAAGGAGAGQQPNAAGGPAPSLPVTAPAAQPQPASPAPTAAPPINNG